MHEIFLSGGELHRRNNFIDSLIINATISTNGQKVGDHILRFYKELTQNNSIRDASWMDCISPFWEQRKQII